MGHKLAVEQFQLDEQTLPLADLSGIRNGDALKLNWPRADAIIGNPPFHGDRNLRGLVGDEYIDWLETTFGIGIKDHCVYWFRKAHLHLRADARAGLVGTNSISQNRGRSESLAYIVANGGTITDAVSTQDWPGAAAVDVSIVNWIKNPTVPPTRFMLDGIEQPSGISPSLVPNDIAVDDAVDLAGNVRRAFIGPVINGEGFILTDAEAQALLANGPEWREIIRPYLVGHDILTRPDMGPSRWVIDFGFRTLEDAALFPAALSIVRERVKPARDQNRDRHYRTYWWQFAAPSREMRISLEGRQRYLASPAQGSRILMAWQAPWTCPSNLTIVFAVDGDYEYGVLSSTAHLAWTAARCSTLEDRTRYTPTTVFMRFPWPSPTPAARAPSRRPRVNSRARAAKRAPPPTSD